MFANVARFDIVNRMIKKSFLFPIILSLLLTLITSFFLLGALGVRRSLTTGLGMYFFLFFPGYLFSFIFWGKTDLSTFNRCIIAPILSILIVPIISFILFKIKIQITLLNLFLSIIITCVIPIFYLVYRSYNLKKNVFKF